MRVAFVRLAAPTLRQCVGHAHYLPRPLLLQLGGQTRFVSSSPNTAPTPPEKPVAPATATAAATDAAATPIDDAAEGPKAKPLPVEYEVKSEKELRNSKPPNLIRPIGLSDPPQPGENSGDETRSWGQRRDDFVSYDKHIVKRKRLYVPPDADGEEARSGVSDTAAARADQTRWRRPTSATFRACQRRSRASRGLRRRCCSRPQNRCFSPT